MWPFLVPGLYDTFNPSKEFFFNISSAFPPLSELMSGNMGFEKCIKIIYEVLGGSNTYFTFDIDGIDPTFAPGTGTPEVGGFNVRETQTIIRALKKINFVGGDVVEVSPPFDLNNMTSLVGATIAFEMLCTDY